MLIQRYRKQSLGVEEIAKPIEPKEIVIEKPREELKTKRDVMKKLDQLGLEYDRKDSKSELLEVLDNAGQN